MKKTKRAKMQGTKKNLKKGKREKHKRMRGREEGRAKALDLPFPTHVWFDPGRCHKRTGFWDVRRSRHAENLLHGMQVGAQTPVHREHLLADDCSDRQAVEALREGPP
jgi:hypothetical protein